MSGLGPDAYGWTGDTGRNGSRGSAPGGFQPQMYAALVAAFAAMGKTFGPAYYTDAYRDYGAQVDLKARKPGAAATPGRSIHGIGLAVDLNNERGDWTQVYSFLTAHGKEYGLVQLPGEEWHWQLDPAAWKGRGASAPTSTMQTAASLPGLGSLLPALPEGFWTKAGLLAFGALLLGIGTAAVVLGPASEDLADGILDGLEGGKSGA